MNVKIGFTFKYQQYFVKNNIISYKFLKKNYVLLLAKILSDY